MKKLFLLLTVATLFFSSCAGPQFFYDYDRQADFSKYKSYQFYSEMDTGLSDLDTGRVFEAIDSVLATKGFVKNASPDFKINLYASYTTRPSGSRIGLGIGGGGGNVGVGVSGGIPVGGPDTYMSLTIEFVEWPSNVLFWQTVIESRFNPQMDPKERSLFFKELIGEALGNYPPE
ncbi:MAG TPA: DUF4136 domain-containing protein [Flavobacteriaceae bacterium]|nr:DUF4136 domain-containing protein [Flavobacteriaceae bacterium]